MRSRVYNNANPNLFPGSVLHKHRIVNLVGLGRNREPFHQGSMAGPTIRYRFLTLSETRFPGSCPFGRGGHFILPWVNNRSIDIANEYMSGRFVAKTPFVSGSSGASCLTLSPDDIVLEIEVTFPLALSEILVIPKSQTSWHLRSALVLKVGCGRRTRLVKDEHGLLRRFN